MDVHQNARLTLACRELLVQRIQAGRPKAQVARELGVSVRTAQKWLRRFLEQDREGLRGPPFPAPLFTPSDARSAQERSCGVASPAPHVGAIAAQFHGGTIAKAAGLSRLSKLEPAPVYPRYERSEAGELLHLDVKKLGRIVRVGHRITGDPRDTVEGAGWEYVHVAIDDASRVAYYAGLGVVIREILTDNGSCYRSLAFRATVQALGSSTASPDPIHQEPTARLSGSSSRRCGNGPMPGPIGDQSSGPMSWRAGCMATTGIGRMPAWQASRRSPESVSTGTTC